MGRRQQWVGDARWAPHLQQTPEVHSGSSGTPVAMRVISRWPTGIAQRSTTGSGLICCGVPVKAAMTARGGRGGKIRCSDASVMGHRSVSTIWPRSARVRATCQPRFRCDKRAIRTASPTTSALRPPASPPPRSLPLPMSTPHLAHV